MICLKIKISTSLCNIIIIIIFKELIAYIFHLVVIWANSLQETINDGLSVKTDSGNSEDETSNAVLILTKADNTLMHSVAEPGSLISFEPTESPAQPDIIRQPSPPPVLAEVQDLIPAVSQHHSSNVLAELQDLIPAVSSQVNEMEHGMGTSLQDKLVDAESPLQLHIVSLLPPTISLPCALRLTFFFDK